MDTHPRKLHVPVTDDRGNPIPDPITGHPQVRLETDAECEEREEEFAARIAEREGGEPHAKRKRKR